MQMHYATEVINLGVSLPSQYGHLNDRNFTVDRLHLGKKCLSSRVSLNLTATRLNGHWYFLRKGKNYICVL